MSARHLSPGTVLLGVSLLTAGVVGATDLTGRISAGIVVDDPGAVVAGLASEPRLEDEDIFLSPGPSLRTDQAIPPSSRPFVRQALSHG